MKFLLLFFISFGTVFANESLVASKFEEVQEKIQELRKNYSAKDILIAIDLDNTLLRAKQNLGSDQWVEWQTEAITKKTSEALFDSVDELLLFQANLYQLSSMALTEPTVPGIVDSFQKAGHPTFILTSRSVFLRSSTERELKNNQLWFEKSSPVRGIPYEFTTAPFKRPVSLMNGIFMTSGHHKGEALDYLVKLSGRRYKAIVFIDDLERHTKRVFDVFSVQSGIEIVTFRYTVEDARVERFKQGSKSEITMQVKELRNITNRIFGKK